MLKASVDMLDPGRTRVVAFDKPLYAIAKQIKWNWPEQYGEHKLVIMFGSLLCLEGVTSKWQRSKYQGNCWKHLNGLMHLPKPV